MWCIEIFQGTLPYILAKTNGAESSKAFDRDIEKGYATGDSFQGESVIKDRGIERKHGSDGSSISELRAKGGKRLLHGECLEGVGLWGERYRNGAHPFFKQDLSTGG